MVIDVVAILSSVPACLALSKSSLQFESFSLLGMGIWIGVAVVSHIIFRLNGLYSTIWRLASTQDFINITRACLILTLGLYLIAVIVRAYAHLIGLNERQFIVFFLITFIVVSAPRLLYRYIRDGDHWRLMGWGRPDIGDRLALFIGGLDEADLVGRLVRNGGLGDLSVAGILATDGDASVRVMVQSIPVLGHPDRLEAVLSEYAQATRPIEMIIFGHKVEQELTDFADLVRVARKADVEVSQFFGVSKIHPGKKLLESVDLERVLHRAAVPGDIARLRAFCHGRRILVTGGAGSIGKMLVQRSLECGAEHVLVVDRSEFGIFELHEKTSEDARSRLSTRLIDITDEEQLSRAVAGFRPDIIFHAAALKHVPILEENWISAIQTNVFGTMICAEVAAKHAVPQFVLISSDKAVDPTSVLGQTKRMAEQIVNALHFEGRSRTRDAGGRTSFIAVRFGNVFDSGGSVATIFRRQINNNLPVTVTDREMTRYFMTIGEAVDLVISSAADAADPQTSEDYGIYMLDMGEPVSILTMAETMIKLAGKQPYTEIPISITGIRPGEKLTEKLHSDHERVTATGVSKILGLTTGLFSRAEITLALRGLRNAIAKNDKAMAIGIMDRTFRPAGKTIAVEGTTEWREATVS